jgi:hypothetical protein
VVNRPGKEVVHQLNAINLPARLTVVSVIYRDSLTRSVHLETQRKSGCKTAGGTSSI